MQEEKCDRVIGLDTKKRLVNELLILIRQLYHIERNILFIGLIDVINLTEEDKAEFIVLAENATHLLSPLNFLAHLTKLAKDKRVLCINACKKEEISRACCMSNDISVIAIKIGPSYLSEKIKIVKSIIMKIIKKSKKNI